MTTHTTVRSWGALSLGLFFAAVTTRTILDDVWHGAPFTIAHLNAFAALVAAIAAGHMVIPTLMARRLVLGLGFLALAIAATGYIVVSGGARNAEISGTKNMEITKRNQERITAKAAMLAAQAQLDAAQRDYRAKRDTAAVECASGRGRRCEGKTATAEAAARDVDKAEGLERSARGEYLLLGPLEQEYAGYKHASATLEAIGIGTAQRTKLKLELGMPFATVLIGEFATLLFIGLALGHKRRIVEVIDRPAADEESPPSPSAEIVPLRPVGPDRFSKAQALEDLMQRLADGRTIGSQDELARDWSRPKQTVSDWLTEWRSIGVVPQAIKSGRCKVMVAA